MNYINTKIYDKKESNTTLVVSRDNILEESFNQFMTTHELDLRKAMQIFFVDEIAQDIGGVYREWYSVLFDSIFNNKFFYPAEGHTYYISVNKPDQDNYSLYYEFFGKIIGKAIFDKITIKMNLNIVLIKQILDMEIVLEDIKYLDINYYNSLKSLLGNKLGETDLPFVWVIKKDNEDIEYELIENGKNTYINDTNKSIFVEKVIRLITYDSIKDKISPLLKGIRSLIPLDILTIFTPVEFDFLLSGQSDIDINDWRQNTIYKGYYTEQHPVIEY